MMTTRQLMVVVGIIGIFGFGLVFLELHETRPFGLLPPIVEAITMAPIMAAAIVFSTGFKTGFDHEWYLRERGRIGLAADLIRSTLGCAFFGIAVGLLIGLLGVDPPWRLLAIAFIEYFSAFWIFAMANARFFDDRRLRAVFDA